MWARSWVWNRRRNLVANWHCVVASIEIGRLFARSAQPLGLKRPRRGENARLNSKLMTEESKDTGGQVIAPRRSRAVLAWIVVLWAIFYASFALVRPPLLDDADSVHAEVAREMLLRHDYVTLYANGIRYLEKAPLLYWSMAASMRVSQAFGGASPRALAAAARIPLALTVLALALLCEAFVRRLAQNARAGLYAALTVLSSFGLFIYSHITLPDAMVCLWLASALFA